MYDRNLTPPAVTLASAIVCVFTSFMASLIPIIGPAILAYFFSRLNKTVGMFSGLALIGIIFIGELVSSLMMASWNQSIIIGGYLFLINAASTSIFFIIGLYKERNDRKKGIAI